MPISASIQTFIDRQADAAPERYDDLRAVVFNGTLKRSPEPSQTDGLLAICRGIFERVGVAVSEVSTVDHEIQPGEWTDNTGMPCSCESVRRAPASRVSGSVQTMTSTPS